MVSATTRQDERTHAAGRADAGSRRTYDMALLALVVIGAALRLWDLGRTAPSIDETYSVLAARMPVGELLQRIDSTDPHGPLYYLILHPIASVTDGVGTLRMVSALLSIAAVVVMAVWQRRAGVAGLVATAVFALSPFQIFYARQMRMYGLLALAGVCAAWCAQRWLVDPRRRWVAGMAAAGVVAALSHATGVILLGALLLLPLLRRDRSSWELRAAVVASGSIFGLLWGAHAVRWSGASGLLPTADPNWLSIVLNEVVAPVPGNRWFLLPLLLAGSVVVVAARGSLARVWICLFVVPVAVLYLASMSRGVLVPKSLMPFAWGVPVALGALCGWVHQRSRIGAGVVVAVLALGLLPYASESMRSDEGSGAAVESLFASAAPGDGYAFATGRWQFESLLEWYGSVEGRRPLEMVEPMGELTVYSPASEQRPPRVWFLAIADDQLPSGLRTCSDPVPHGVFTAQCVETGAG